MEACSSPEGEEEELDLEPHLQLDRHAASSLDRYPGIYSHRPQCETEGIRSNIRAYLEFEFIVRISDGVGSVGRLDVKVEVAFQPEGARTKQHVRRHSDIEVAIRLQMNVPIKGEHAEDVQLCLSVNRPCPVNNHHLEARLKGQNLEQLHGAGH